MASPRTGSHDHRLPPPLVIRQYLLIRSGGAPGCEDGPGFLRGWSAQGAEDSRSVVTKGSPWPRSSPPRVRGLPSRNAPRRPPRRHSHAHLPRSTPPHHRSRPGGPGRLRRPHRPPAGCCRDGARTAVVAAGLPTGHAGQHRPRRTTQVRPGRRCTAPHLPRPAQPRGVRRSTRPAPLRGMGPRRPGPLQRRGPAATSAVAPGDRPRRLRRPPRPPLSPRLPLATRTCSRRRRGRDQPWTTVQCSRCHAGQLSMPRRSPTAARAGAR
jgi:hypothetical protein